MFSLLTSNLRTFILLMLSCHHSIIAPLPIHPHQLCKLMLGNHFNPTLTVEAQDQPIHLLVLPLLLEDSRQVYLIDLFPPTITKDQATQMAQLLLSQGWVSGNNSKVQLNHDTRTPTITPTRCFYTSKT